jgi:hypothetical protein
MTRLVVGCACTLAGCFDPTYPDTSLANNPTVEVARCAGPIRKVWEATFDASPLDQNADADDEHWVLRSGSQSFDPVSGVWASSSTRELDTRPLDSFATRTIARARMRNMEVPSIDAGLAGAVLWLNVDEHDGMLAAVSAQLRRRTNAQQELQLHIKTGSQDHVVVAIVPIESTDFVEVELDVEPSAGTVGLAVDRVAVGTYPYTRFAYQGVTPDKFATLATFDTASEFDDVWIESCVDR